MYMIIRTVVFCFVLQCAFGGFLVSAYAAEKAPVAGKATPDTPATSAQRQTQVSIMHEGTDSVGTRLSTRVKELFNGSNLFQLNENNAPKMRILLTSKAEFSDRPNVGSVYSIIWVFSQSSGHLGYLLAQDVDTLTPEDVDIIAAKIVERTDGIAVKYAYLFQ